MSIEKREAEVRFFLVEGFLSLPPLSLWVNKYKREQRWIDVLGRSTIKKKGVADESAIKRHKTRPKALPRATNFEATGARF
jgi:hypothetical protein